MTTSPLRQQGNPRAAEIRSAELTAEALSAACSPLRGGNPFG